MNLNQKIAAILSQGEVSIYSYKDGRAEANNEQLRMLRLLHAQSSPDSRIEFGKILLKQLTPENAQLVCHAILDTERITYLNHILTTPMTRIPVIEQVLCALEERLSLEPHRFSEKDLEDLEGTLRRVKNLTYQPANDTLKDVLEQRVAMQTITSAYSVIQQRIHDARYAHVKMELFEGINPEINTDKEALLSRIAALGFRGEIARALEEVDKKLATAATDLEFKGVMDVVRGIYEEVFEDAAKSVAKVRSKTIPPGSHFKPFKDFLVSESLLSSDEGELSQKLYNYLSNAGSHTLSSAPEQVRVTKNIVIELCLLVLGRVQNVR